MKWAGREAPSNPSVLDAPKVDQYQSYGRWYLLEAPWGRIMRPMAAGRVVLGMAWAWALAAGVAAAGGAGEPRRETVFSPADPPGRADYVLRARVEDEDKRLTGGLTLRWTNASSVPTRELWFHLYWNAFANDRSTHLIEAGGRLRGRDVQADGADEWGWQRVTSIHRGSDDLLPTLRYRQPDGGSPDDRTVFSVELPEEVAPGATVEVALEWEARIPRVRRRTGYKGDFLFMAHWFPKLGVFEGERGWNCHEFHANTEFYSNYGWYDVTLDLPARYDKKIFASGTETGPFSVVGERVTARFAAPSLTDRTRIDATGKRPLVHDFTWTADPRFKLRRDTFNYDRWRSDFEGDVRETQAALGEAKDLRLRTVDVSVLIHPEREDQWQRHFEATCAALFFYGLWFGEYPYEHITVVDPAWGAGAAGGMEYPTIFTAGTRLFTRPSMHTPESVTVHEAGHQFWYGLVGNNEFESAWLDEGFNSYTDSEVLWRWLGPSLATTDYSGVPFQGVPPAPGPGGGSLARLLSLQLIPLPVVGFKLEPLRRGGLVDLWRDQPWLTAVEQTRDPRGQDRVRYLADPDRDAIDTHGWKYADRRGYSTNSYPRTAVALRTLEGLVGRAAFLRGMRHYAETWRYRHPVPDDFFATFQQGAGVDVGWYFEEAFRSTGTLDWSVDVEQSREQPPSGWFQDAPGEAFARRVRASPAVPPAEAAGAPAQDGAEAEAPPAPPAREARPWKARVTLTRRGELRLPLAYELSFEDGTTERGTWSREAQAESRWTHIDLLGRPKLVAVRLDPDATCWLDANLSDNHWYDATDRLAPLRWSERVHNRWVQLLFWQAGIGG